MARIRPVGLLLVYPGRPSRSLDTRWNLSNFAAVTWYGRDGVELCKTGLLDTFRQIAWYIFLFEVKQAG